MSGSDKAAGMKSAYELAIEQLESRGIDKPREEGLPAELRERVAEARSHAEAKLAELEILHRDRSKNAEADPVAQTEAESEYLADRRRVESRRDDEIDAIRREADGDGAKSDGS